VPDLGILNRKGKLFNARTHSSSREFMHNAAGKDKSPKNHQYYKTYWQETKSKCEGPEASVLRLKPQHPKPHEQGGAETSTNQQTKAIYEIHVVISP